MKKPELLVSAGSLQELQKLIAAGADAVLIGEHKYDLRLPGEVTLEQMEEAISWAHEHGAKVYVAVNQIFDNEGIRELPQYLSKLQQFGVDALVFGDPSLLIAVRDLPEPIALHWNAEMTSTNYATANYWASKGASRTVLARELNMDQVLDFKNKVNHEAQVQVHGITNIYHSKRELVKNYMEHQGKDAAAQDRSQQQGLYLIEHERRDQRYPIYEDQNGTHIMSSEDICMLENLPELIEGRIDSLKIEGLLKSIAYNEAVVQSYRLAIDEYMKDPEGYQFNPEWLERIQALQDPERELSYGFFYKEQVY
ncbi:putative protease YhbU precursor [compost metagenome]